MECILSGSLTVKAANRLSVDRRQGLQANVARASGEVLSPAEQCSAALCDQPICLWLAVDGGVCIFTGGSPPSSARGNAGYPSLFKGTYRACARDELGCVSRESLTVHLRLNCSEKHVPEHKRKNGMWGGRFN